MLKELRSGHGRRERRQLSVSPDTVKYPVSNMLERCGLKDRSRLIWAGAGAAAVTAVLAGVVIGFGLPWLASSPGNSCADGASVALVAGESPQPLTLTLISDGKPGAVLLEWSGGPADATGWQYRFNKTDPLTYPFTNSAQWRDIPGGCPDTRRYRLSGQPLLPPGKPGIIYYRTSEYLQVRPLMGATAGQASPYVEWVRVWPFRPTFTLSPALVQGNGRTEWYTFWGDLVLTLPAGVRLLGEERLEFCPNIHVQCNWSVLGEIWLTEVASGSLLVLDWRTGEEKKRMIEGGEDGRVGRLFDQLAASVRKLREPSPDRTPLHLAAASSDPGVVRALLDAGADIEARTDLGLTPLHAAVEFNESAAVVRALLDAGADVEAEDHRGVTPIDEAARHDNPEVRQALMDAGASFQPTPTPTTQD